MGVKNAIPGKISNPNNLSSQWPAGLELMDAVALSSTNTVTSPTFNASNLDNVGLQVTFAGTMVGTITVNCSIDNVNFQPLTFAPALAQPAGSNLSYLISLNQVPFPYIQVSYTNSGGSGTLTVYLSAKDLN
jgi:hypothetical protein